MGFEEMVQAYDSWRMSVFWLMLLLIPMFFIVAYIGFRNYWLVAMGVGVAILLCVILVLAFKSYGLKVEIADYCSERGGKVIEGECLQVVRVK